MTPNDQQHTYGTRNADNELNNQSKLSEYASREGQGETAVNHNHQENTRNPQYGIQLAGSNGNAGGQSQSYSARDFHSNCTSDLLSATTCQRTPIVSCLLDKKQNMLMKYGSLHNLESASPAY